MVESASSPLFIALPKLANLHHDESKGNIPLSLIALVNYLHMLGIDSDILDLSTYENHTETSASSEYHYEITKQVIEKLNPAYVGINCFTTGQFPQVCYFASRIKHEFPSVPIVVGGVHPSLFAKDIIDNCPYIDYVVVGEGEEQSAALIDVCAGKRERLPHIQALAWRDEHNVTHVNPRKTFLEDINIPPLPGWQKIDLKKYHVETRRWNNPKGLSFNMAFPIITTRSCPFSCSFCSVSGVMGKKLRLREAQSVLDEIEYFHKELGQNYFEFVDDNINVNREHAMKIFTGISKRKLNIHFSLTAGIHMASADEKLIDTMYAAGMAFIKFPIEHGNDYIRNVVIGKKLERNKIISITKHIKQYPVFAVGMFIVGFPEDTEETIQDTVAMIHEMQLDLNVAAFLAPYPSTRVYDQCVRDNLLIHTMDAATLYKGDSPLDPSDDFPYIKPYNLSIERLMELKQELNKLYFYTDLSKQKNIS